MTPYACLTLKLANRYPEAFRLARPVDGRYRRTLGTGLQRSARAVEARRRVVNVLLRCGCRPYVIVDLTGFSRDVVLDLGKSRYRPRRGRCKAEMVGA